MRKSNGFTLIELLIVIVAILIIAVVVWDSTREAGAAEVSPLTQVLDQYDVGRVWESTKGSLTIVQKGTAPWANATEACVALREYGVTRVIFSDASTTTKATELHWDANHELTNLGGRSEAYCAAEPVIEFGPSVSG